MKYLMASRAILCVCCFGLTDAASVSTDAGNFLSMQQQLQIISAGAASNQAHWPEQAKRATSSHAHTVAKPPRAEKKVLLSIVQKLSKRAQQGAKSREASSASLQTQAQLHDKELMANVGRLEHQIESANAAEHQLEQQLASQRQTVKSLQAAQIQGTGALFVVKMWQNRRMLSIAALSIVLSVFVFCTVWQNRGNLTNHVVSSFKRDKRETNALAKAHSSARAEMQQPMPQEVAEQLADLADAVGRVKVPSDGAFQVAMEALEASGPEDCSVATQLGAGPAQAAN